MGDDVDRGRQPHDRVPDELSRSVPGDLAPAVDVDDRRAVEGPLVRLGALAGGEDRLVLEQQHGVLSAVNHGRVDLALVVPGCLVVDEVRCEPEVLKAHAEKGTPGNPELAGRRMPIDKAH